MSTDTSKFDSEFWRRARDGRWVWEVFPNTGSAQVLARGESRFRLLAIIGLRRALTRLARSA